MLVLTRKLNEAITIGNEGITIKIVDVRGSRVRLGIEAPQDVRIERSEVHAAEVGSDQRPELVRS